MPSGAGGGILSNPPAKPAEGAVWAFVNGAWQQTNTLGASFGVNLQGTPTSRQPTGTPIGIVGANSTSCSYEMESYSAAAGIDGYVAEGTAQSPAITAAGRQLIALRGFGWTQAGTWTFGASIDFQALNAWVQGVDSSTYIRFRTCLSGSWASATERMRLTANLLIGGTTDITGSGGLKLFGTTAATAANTGAFQCAGGGYFAGDLVLGGVYRIGTTQVVGAQVTGYGTPTGNSRLSAFPGATATLAQCSAQIAQMIIDLKTHGLFGA